MLVTSGSLGLLLLSVAPNTLLNTIPMNESRRLPFITEYFIDEETYFFAILAHTTIANYAGSVTVAAIATMLIAYALHTCAMFKIAR